MKRITFKIAINKNYHGYEEGDEIKTGYLFVIPLLPNHYFTVHKYNSTEWIVSEYSTGRHVSSGKTRKDAICHAIDRLSNSIDEWGKLRVLEEISLHPVINKSEATNE